MRRPSEKVRQAVHEREETVQRRDAKAQKDRERRRRRHLIEEGSENEDEEHSDEGRDIESEDLDEEEEEGTHFSSHPVPSRLSAVPRQHLTPSNSKVPRMVGGNIPNPSGQGAFYSDGELDAGPTTHNCSSERQIVKQKNRHVEHASSEGMVTDTTNRSDHVRAKRRREPIEEDGPETTIVKAQKLTEHEGRPRARDYDDVTQEFVITAIGDYRVRLCAEGPMPDHTQEATLLKASWAKALQTTGVNLVRTPQLAKLITNRSSQVRGELKAKLRPLVEGMFGFHSSQTKPAIKKNRALAEELKEGANFAFKHRALVQDERRGFLKAPIIQKIINTMWFANKNDEGVKHHALFKPFPLPALALVLTAIECCVDEWTTGTRTDIPFTVNDYRAGYDCHLQCLQDFDEATKEFGVLKGICAKIYEDGRIHSGAPAPSTQPQNVVSAHIIAAAIKEHQEGSTTEDESE